MKETSKKGIEIIMKKEKPKYKMAGNIAYVFKNLWRWDKTVIFYGLLQAVVDVLLPTLGIYLPKLVIEKITTAISPFDLILSIGLISIAIATLNYLNGIALAHVNSGATYNRMQYMFAKQSKIMSCDYENIESAIGQTKIQKATNATWGGNTGMNTIIRISGPFIANVLGFFLYSGIVSSLNPIIMLLLTVGSIAHYFVIKRINSLSHKNKDNWAPIDKKLYYLRSKSTEFACGKDIRLYSMKKWFLENYNLFLSKRIYWLRKMGRKQYTQTLSNAAIALLRDSIAYIYLIISVYQGNISVADFVLYFGAIAGFSSFVTGIIECVGELNRSSLDISDIRDFLDMPDTSRKTGGKPIPMSEVSIEFKNVHFKYSQADADYVIKGVSFKINAGEKLAVVGANGAGKTTIVKLLCGFYKPTSGEILLNGTSLSDFNRDDIYSIFSAIFQDLVILPFTVAESISMSALDKTDIKRAQQCLELVGLSKRLPDPNATLLKVLRDDGIELSGGEAQKLMMARALYKNAPVLILDEPTSALDPIAESELYEKYHELVSGKTSIFISHRLASTRFCDRIAYIENGIISELGSHDELMRLNGGYANMYEIQSHYYKKEAANHNEE